MTTNRSQIGARPRAGWGGFDLVQTSGSRHSLSKFETRLAPIRPYGSWLHRYHPMGFVRQAGRSAALRAARRSAQEVARLRQHHPWRPQRRPPAALGRSTSLPIAAAVIRAVGLELTPTPEKGRAERAAWGDGKTANIIKPSPTPAEAPLQEGRWRSEGPGQAGSSASPRIPAPREKLAALSLLGRKNSLLLRSGKFAERT
jgi:hypothetical protein